jgi:hypothetical protein
MLAGTLAGIVVGLVAVAVWVVTFSPHGGVELSMYLFPISATLLSCIYGNASVPALLWFASAILQWVAIGVCVDLVRFWKRRRIALATQS